MMIISVVVYSLETKDNLWLYYMTSWNYMLGVTYFIFAFVKQVNYERAFRVSYNRMHSVENGFDQNENKHLLQPPNTNSMTKSDKIYWLLFSTSFNLMMVVVIIYWSLLFDSDKSTVNKFFLFESIDRHAIIFILFMIEYFFNTIPVRILHLVYPAAVGFIYFAFNYAFYRSTDKLIYPIFDWKKSPNKALECFGGVCLLAVVLQFICFGIDTLKHYLGKRSKS